MPHGGIEGRPAVAEVAGAQLVSGPRTMPRKGAEAMSPPFHIGAQSRHVIGKAEGNINPFYRCHRKPQLDGRDLSVRI